MIRCKSILLPALALAVSLAGIAGTGLAQDATTPVAITNVRIFDGTRVIPKGTVVFQGNRIAAVGAHVPPPRGAEIVDGSGQTVLPGFIDSHNHNWGESLQRALVFGVTTQLDMFTTPDFAKQMREEQ